MKAFIIGCATLFAFAVVAPAAQAYHDEDASNYTAADKLGRGLADMTTGFLELPGNIVAENRDHGATSAATIGFAKGLGMIPVRELIGVYNFVTSPFPYPNDYGPILHPEYPWGYFDGAHSASFDRRAARDIED
jgi:putative exosortase-associated protein (TIGR04073 family)